MINFIKKILILERFQKQFLVYVIDISLFIFSLFISIIIRFDLYLFSKIFEYKSFLIGIIIFTFFYISFGLYRTIFRYSNLNIIRIIFLATLSYALLFFIINIYYLQLPNSITIIQPLIFFLLVSIFRLCVPLFIKLINKNIIIPNAVIYGAGANGSAILNNLTNFKIKYFIDDDNSLVGKNISNKKIYANNKINNFKNDDITHVFISFKIKNSEHKKSILEKFHELDLIVRFMPEFETLAEPSINFDQFLQINFNDLIKQNKFNKINFSSNNFVNTTVLVTGGGGSIGSELCKQLLELNVKRLIIIDNSEFNLYSVNNNLVNQYPNINIIPYLISVENYKQLEKIYENYKFDYVFHAAAYKHVPLIENNIISSVKNNIIGSYNVAKLSKKYSVSNLLLVSTDKAVKPTNIMGATKRISEKIFSAFAQIDKNMNISIVRFGNVINSNGSVVPLFNSQIKNRGPVTVTHPDVTRYLMTIPDAVKLILETIIISKQNKSGLIYLLDMGKPIKILDLAKKMINLYGLKVGPNSHLGEIEIKYIGLRPGEKLHEELYLTKNIKKTKNEKIFLVDDNKEKFSEIDNKVIQLSKYLDSNEIKYVLDFLNNNVEGFKKDY